MLSSIVLKNFVHFKDKTVINLHTKSKVKKEESNPRTGKKSKSDVQGRTSDNGNALNIFVGANFCGKSTILELIRRCMTKGINVTETNLFDDKSIAYVFCKFDLDPYEEFLSGIIKVPGEDLYKIIMYIDKTESFLKFLDCSENTYKCPLQNFDQKKIESMFEKNPEDTCIDDTIRFLLNKIKHGNQKENIVSLECTPNWTSIQDKYIATFPLRGIGSVQWTNSTKIKNEENDENDENDENNYEQACKRAEVITTLLLLERSDKEKEREEKIFKFITYPEEFAFEALDEKTVNVKHGKNVFPLLKVSEGILEAKIASLLLAHDGIETLCLEDPDRGMHPQMIERLKKELYRNARTKTIIVVTHSPYFIDTYTINKTHVFFRKKADRSYVCSVRNAGHSKELSRVSDIETLRSLLFATKVLLVEGASDREVVQGILTQHRLLKEGDSSGDDFTNISSYQIITIGGCENAGKVRKFCKFINLPCLCLLDRDKPLKVTDGIITDIWGIKDQVLKKDLKDRYVDKELQLFLSCDEDFETFLEALKSKEKIFIWKCGDLEDAILSSPSSQNDIARSLNMEDVTKSKLKSKIRERLEEGERKAFYTELIKVDEIKRFIAFMEEEENELKRK